MSQQEQDAVDEICRGIYAETKSFYAEIFKSRPDDPGFQILLGPPRRFAPILFIGYQPGRGTKTALEERAYGSECKWPKVCEYATEVWPLAKRIREMLAQSTAVKVTAEECVGTNAIFVRACSVAKYCGAFDCAARREIAAFCVSRTERMIEAIQPKLIIAIGLATLHLFDGGSRERMTDSESVVRENLKGRALIRIGQIAGRSALGVLHLSGAHISSEDRCEISSHIRSIVESGDLT